MKLLRSGLVALAALGLSSCATWFERPVPTESATPAEAPAPAPPPASAPVPVPAPAASPPAAQPAAARPALWKISDADTTIWLFGTIHVLPPGFRWENAPITQAVAAADSLVIETVIDKSKPEEMAALLFNLGTTAGLPPLLDRVAPDKREGLQRMIGRSNIPAPVFNALETWAGAFMLVGVSLNELGLDPNSGVEETLQAHFRANGRPIEGLETPTQQLAIFDTLPEDAQRDFLGTLVEDQADIRREFDAMLAAWSAGDEAGIAATFDEEIEISPRLREVLLRDRNAAWTDWLVHRLERPGKVFVAVGAGHLVGSDSVRTMLAARGIRVERVQ